MKYVSTRGQAPVLGFSDVLLAGLASDGGLYVPESWPALSPGAIAGFAGRPYADVAFEILRLFVGGAIADRDLRRMCVETYAGFRHDAVAPLVQIGPNEWILELFHGPTLAFKDFAMQLLARLMDHVLAERGERITIIGATSGDTGAAAVEAFKERSRTDLFMLFPRDRVSPIQQRQMTTVAADNIETVAIEGTFDDCQGLVKAMFGNPAFRQRLSLTAVNSINWARIAAQIVYYFTAAAALGAPVRPVAFTVPTGNFGDIFAGYCAKRMGLSVDKLVIATNVNDILARTLATGRYEPHNVIATTSPSMDIQISSNFERQLFEAYGRDATAIADLMASLAATGAFTIAAGPLERIRSDFAASATDEAQVATTLRRLYDSAGFLADPHTAVGLAAARQFTDPAIPMVTLSTAHPAKFPTAVKAATGRTPDLPASYDGLMSREENYAVLAKDQASVEDFVISHSRAVVDEV